MTVLTEVSLIVQKLAELGTEQTRKTYARHGITGNVYGVSFGNLAKLAKQIKLNHDIALQLWQSGNFDARCLALMVAEPHEITFQQLEDWIRDVNNSSLADMLAGFIQKTPYAQECTDRLIASERELSVIIGWGILSSMALHTPDVPNAYFEAYLMMLQSTLQTSKNDSKHAMNKALIACGCRNTYLKTQAQTIAQTIGKVVVDHGKTACKTPDAFEYIEKAWLRKQR